MAVFNLSKSQFLHPRGVQFEEIFRFAQNDRLV